MQTFVRTLFVAVASLALVTACSPAKSNFVGTWVDDKGRAVIDNNTAAFYNLSGRLEGQWPVTISDDHHARVDSPLGSGSMTLLPDGSLQVSDGSAQGRHYTRVSSN
jgi:hypothetical protein